MNADPIPDFATKPPPPRPWHDHRGWTAALAADRAAIYRWVASARGFVEGRLAFLPTLEPGTARNALTGALMAQGLAARIGAASSPRPDFGRELRGRGFKVEAKLVVRFAMEAIADRGHERVVSGGVADGAGRFALSVVTPQREGDLLTLHRAPGGLRVEGRLATTAVGADTVPVVGTIMACAT